MSEQGNYNVLVEVKKTTIWLRKKDAEKPIDGRIKNQGVIMIENKIILIEDDKEIRGMINDYLSGEFEVTAFNDGMSAIQKITSYGSLKGFNREGKDVTHIDVNDERTAELLEKACKKSHIPVDMKKVTRADGSITHTAFCEVKSIDQMAALLKMASEQVLEEQKEMTKTLVLYDDKGKEVMSADFVNNGEINMDDVETLSRFSTRFEIKDHKNEVLESGSITPNAKEEIKEAARKHNPKKDKSLTERIKDKKEQSQKKQKDKNRQREKTKKKSRDTSL